MANIGEMIGRYRVEKVIGSGGMSTVYKVKDMRVGTILALKEIPVVKKENLISGFAEADVLRNVSHPSLPRITDIVRREDSYCVVMDYIDGENLEKYVEKNGHFTEEKVREIGLKILDCLIFLHSRKVKIIHGDLKPSNILICDGGDIFLIDFGISHFFMEKFSGALFATKEFASPEQIMGKEADERSDIYSFGATLKYLMGDNVSPEMNFFLKKCLQADKEKRFENSADARWALLNLHKLNREYTNNLKRIISRNLFCFIIFLLSLSGLYACLFHKNSIREKEYEKIVKEALEGANEDIRKEKLEILIGKEKNLKWFDMYFEEIKNDSVFDSDEEAAILRIIEREEAELNEEEIAYLYFEAGRLYLFYSNDSDNIRERFASAVTWFDKSFEAGNEEAKVYSDIGGFFSNIQNLILEGRDGNSYALFYENLKELLSEVGDEDVSVKFEVYALCADSIYAYAGDFLREGADKKELKSILDRILKEVESTGNTGVRNEKKKSEILKRIAEAKVEIDFIESLK
ncbi:MAG: serine/threonine protein kinase [Lachnospiraceae bacterium]|nr:serine/threonine protein kinase [Lachnospiraceae bacterium]